MDIGVHKLLQHDTDPDEEAHRRAIATHRSHGMDSTSLMLSLLFGAIGMGMFMYGRKAGRMVPLGAGAALMAVPYFIPNAIALLLVCCGITALPWIVREQ